MRNEKFGLQALHHAKQRLTMPFCVFIIFAAGHLAELKRGTLSVCVQYVVIFVMIKKRYCSRSNISWPYVACIMSGSNANDEDNVTCVFVGVTDVI